MTWRSILLHLEFALAIAVQVAVIGSGVRELLG